MGSTFSCLILILDDGLISIRRRPGSGGEDSDEKEVWLNFIYESPEQQRSVSGFIFRIDSFIYAQTMIDKKIQKILLALRIGMTIALLRPLL
jgi:hypothetical protein